MSVKFIFVILKRQKKKQNKPTITQSNFYPIQNEIYSSNISIVMETFLRTNINSEPEMQLIPKEICLCHSILNHSRKQDQIFLHFIELFISSYYRETTANH